MDSSKTLCQIYTRNVANQENAKGTYDYLTESLKL